MEIKQWVAPIIDELNYAGRQAMLKAIPKAGRIKNKKLAQGLCANSVWNRDVSVLDSRSVKAYLAGKGDLRVLWWKTFCVFHRIVAKRTTLEWAMHDFHKMHHHITLFSVWYRLEVQAITRSILEVGVIKALVNHMLVNYDRKKLF